MTETEIVSFVLRFTKTSNDSSTPSHIWRGVIRHVQSEEHCNFTRFSDAMAFMEKYVELSPEEPMDNFALVNDINLHYLDYGGAGEPLILMPGLTANAHSFDGLIAAGLSEHFRVLAVDLRGRGQSDKPETGYSMADHAADIIGLMDALELEKVILGGHSFGGLLTIYMAAHFPERVEKLVILDAAGELHPNIRQLIQPSLDRLGMVFPSWEVYKTAIQNMPFLMGYWDDAMESFFRADVIFNADGTVQPRSKPEAIGEAAEKGLLEPWQELLRQIDQPALLLNAPEPYGPPGTPPVTPEDKARETVAALKNGRYRRVPGNHMTMLFGENARTVVKAIVEFEMNRA